MLDTVEIEKEIDALSRQIAKTKDIESVKSLLRGFHLSTFNKTSDYIIQKFKEL